MTARRRTPVMLAAFGLAITLGLIAGILIVWAHCAAARIRP